jgi:hypothetical protein
MITALGSYVHVTFVVEIVLECLLVKHVLELELGVEVAHLFEFVTDPL